ncbi:poly(U)-specific 3'-to-5' RNA exonuclease [Malassezia japonica]|uniref:U6 snRNA phosphodiesterase 1 n=1 Tax=Malassezia japonica TaxID=223818 RepID=A0AAF0JC21_9BASI|nr:poly(U)-specific 3'-to-5' RNA exonuclease [Malassezia japonica]WFD40830.1 poly(U)-specific 3'-to-5' RNA exonuclease [Malassezia japonica]
MGGLVAYSDSEEEEERLHLSLTRPILIRKHEQKSFVDQAAQCVRESQVERFSVGFARFTSFPSDTSDRVFLALETNAGWHELQSLTKALSQRLYALFRAPMYYQQPRFHASVAYCEPTEACPRAALERIGEELASALNRSLDT